LYRPFSATAHLGFEEPRTIKELETTGLANLAQTKPLDYSSLSGFKSFESEINTNFSLEKTEPATNKSQRTGLIGYKMGMTHYWDKWGAAVPCTVIQVDRCQVTQIKTMEKDGVNAV
jgi:hypothetical protein